MNEELSPFAKAIAKALVESTLGTTHVEIETNSEVVELKKGEKIEDVMTARGYTPVGEMCEGCKVRHEWTNPEGKTIFIAGAELLDEPDVKPEEEPTDEQRGRQAKALRSLDTRLAEVQEALGLLQSLRAPIASDIKERSPTQMIEEITKAMRAKQLLTGGL